MLQQEKNIRTQLEALRKEKNQRMQQLKALLEQDQDLCDILCSMPYGIDADSVPSLEQLANFQQHIANQNKEKVKAHVSHLQRVCPFVCCVSKITSEPGLSFNQTFRKEQLDYILQ